MNKNPPVILLEGFEGVGKTTHSKKLEREHGYTYVKLPTPGSDYEKIIFSNWPDELKAVSACLDFNEHIIKDKKLVLDRGPISTAAYQGEDIAFRVLPAFSKEACKRITHVYILDVDTQTGLNREEKKNFYSTLDLETHNNINNNFKRIGKTLEKMIRLKRLENDFDDNAVIDFSCDNPWATIFPNLRDAKVIDTNKLSLSQVYEEIIERSEI